MEKFEKEKERKRVLLNDKRVKHIEECDYCKAIISRNKYQKNGGYCDNCIEALY
jgi:glycerol-3-phosphate cytidylyltransferase-like family protein